MLVLKNQTKKYLKSQLKKQVDKPDECIMVGDKDSDIDPANDLGMFTICIGKKAKNAKIKIEKFERIIEYINGA